MARVRTRPRVEGPRPASTGSEYGTRATPRSSVTPNPIFMRSGASNCGMTIRSRTNRTQHGPNGRLASRTRSDWVRSRRKPEPDHDARVPTRYGQGDYAYPGMREFGFVYSGSGRGAAHSRDAAARLPMLRRLGPFARFSRLSGRDSHADRSRRDWVRSPNFRRFGRGPRGLAPLIL